MTFHVRLISLPDRTNDLDEALAVDVGRWRRSHDVIGRMRSCWTLGLLCFLFLLVCQALSGA